jgi:hypothetical protein
VIGTLQHFFQEKIVKGVCVFVSQFVRQFEIAKINPYRVRLQMLYIDGPAYVPAQQFSLKRPTKKLSRVFNEPRPAV